MRGTWIEIRQISTISLCNTSRPSCEGRGLKSYWQNWGYDFQGRPSCEGRGLKSDKKIVIPAQDEVVPHARDVD